ncbi:MAG: hypothetical protein DRG33_00110 [Deltaproteobacteria bacterium]|nr:MAG: hypothetical protein DRG33_00110 [Deltaproteobacteria bacterium]
MQNNMAFEWQAISVGDIIRKGHIIEIRQNIDSIKDNLACVTDKSGYDSGYNSSVDNNDHGSYKSGYNSGVDWDEHGNYYSSDDSGHDDQYYNTYHTDENSTIEIGEVVTHT